MTEGSPRRFIGPCRSNTLRLAPCREEAILHERAAKYDKVAQIIANNTDACFSRYRWVGRSLTRSLAPFHPLVSRPSHPSFNDPGKRGESSFLPPRPLRFDQVSHFRPDTRLYRRSVGRPVDRLPRSRHKVSQGVLPVPLVEGRRGGRNVRTDGRANESQSASQLPSPPSRRTLQSSIIR